MENENISFTDFAEAFDDSADYQTDSNEEEVFAEEEGATEDLEEETSQPEEGAENGSTDSEEGDEKNPAEESKEETPAETFTLKVNKEEKTYSREEVISLAQKGADYDRVKEQLEKSRQTTQEMQTQLDSQKESIEVLNELAKEAGVELPQLLKNLRLNMLTRQGLTKEAAEERLLRLQAERENAALKAAASEAQSKETPTQRAQREIEEFRKEYPDTELSEDLLNELMKDVQNGMSLTGAYRKHESAQKDARIAELQRQLEAEKQNKANRAASPGSQKDSGGRRTKSDYDDFMEAFG
jgi:hypothetical protein